MVRILFICTGNICRSPMAEFVMKRLVAERGLAEEFEIASAATSMEEYGNPVYPPARKKLLSVGIDPRGKTARQVKASDYQRYDYLPVMDSYNIRSIRRILPRDPEGKIFRLLEATDRPRDIADPWYTGDFDTAYEEILEGCEALLAKILRGEKIRRA